MTDDRPHIDQNPTPYLQALALTALYFLIRTMGGQSEDAGALTALASPLLAIRL